MAKIMEGKLSSKEKAPANRESSQSPPIEPIDSDHVFKHGVLDPLSVHLDSDQVSNHEVLDPLSVHVDSDQVLNHEVLDPLSVHQENNLDRKIDLQFPPKSQEHIPEPSVPDPFEDTSWLAIEIEKLLNKKSQMALSKLKFEVNPKAASSNFDKLAKNNFDRTW